MGLESKKIKMANETQNTPIEWIQKLQQYRSKEKQDELAKILDYGEKIKAEGERKKQEFWETYNRCDFECLLRYYWTHIDEVEKRYKYLDLMSGLERKKFIEEYLYNDILYNEKSVGNMSYYMVYNHTKQGYSYEEWKNGKVKIKNDIFLYFGSRKLSFDDIKEITKNLELKEGIGLLLNNCGIDEIGLMELVNNLTLKKCVELNLSGNHFGSVGANILSKLKLESGIELDLSNNEIGDDGAEAIANNLELKEGVFLDLHDNQIGLLGAVAIAKYLKLKEGVYLDLNHNDIGDKGAVAIANNLELKEGVYLNLSENQIGNDGAKAIIENMKLKNGVTLDLEGNNITEGVKQSLKDWEKSYQDKGIKCAVLVG